MPSNLPFDLQGQIVNNKTIGDIQGIAQGISECAFVETQNNVVASTVQTLLGGTDVNRACIRITSANANDAISINFTALAGRAFVIINDSGQTITLFPLLGDKINDAAINASVDIANNTMSEYFCPVLGLWFGGATTLET